MNTDPYRTPSYAGTGSVDLAVAGFFRTVFLWMTVGLAVTGLTALFVASSPTLVVTIFGNTLLRWVVILAPIAIVFGMSAAVDRLSAAAATGLFLLYSFVNGISFAAVFLVYTGRSIAQTFFIAGGMFGALSLFGFVTKRNLSGVGQFFFMGLIGLVIASVVNIFLQSDALSWAVSVIGIVIFAGLTAYDTQRLRHYAVENAHGGGSAVAKVAIFGALTLYLDFINIFLFLLRLFGGRRD